MGRPRRAPNASVSGIAADERAAAWTGAPKVLDCFGVPFLKERRLFSCCRFPAADYLLLAPVRRFAGIG